MMTRSNETLGEQAVRIAMGCALRGGVCHDDVDDCAMSFLHRKIEPDDMFRAAWIGDAENDLVKMAETYTLGYAIRKKRRSKRSVSINGHEGTEATGPAGPAGQLVSRTPGPEEVLLAKTIM